MKKSEFSYTFTVTNRNLCFKLYFRIKTRMKISLKDQSFF